MHRETVWVLCIGGFLAAGAAQAAEPRDQVTLGEPAELLKLPRDAVPPLGWACPLLRLSPDGQRFLYLRASDGGGKVIPHLGGYRPRLWDDPVPWEGHGIFLGYARLGLFGVAWRNDSQRVLFLQPQWKDGGGFEEHYERTMSPWQMRWDLPNPQCTLCRHMGLERGLGCTAVSFSRDGQALWTAFGDWANYGRCGVTEWDETRQRGSTIHKSEGVVILHLTPSPDDTRLAWLEYPQRRAGAERPRLAVFDRKAGKVVRRIDLNEHSDLWTDAQPPVWTADSRAVLYGLTVSIDRIYRREVRLLGTTAGEPRLIALDAIVVAAVPGGAILNRGPAAKPMKDLISSFAPVADPRPRSDDVVLRGLSGDGAERVLVPNAYAQDVVAGSLIYAQVLGKDVIVCKAALKGLPAPRGGSGGPCGQGSGTVSSAR